MASDLLPTPAVYLMAVCPHCGFGLNPIPAGTGPAYGAPTEQTIAEAMKETGDTVVNGNYQTKCESCTEPFVVPVDVSRNVQWMALLILGEA